MSTVSRARGSSPVVKSRRPRGRLGWPLGFTIAIIFLFVLYQFILPQLDESINTAFRAWLPVSAIITALTWSVMALGLNVVVGYAGLLDLGYVAFWAIGGYVAGWLMASPFKYNITFHLLSPPVQSSQDGIHITFWLVLLIAAAICAFFGLLIGAPTLRLRGDYLALVTLGFGEVITQFFKNSDNVAGLNVANGDSGIQPIDPIGTGPIGTVGTIPKALGISGSANIYKILVFGVLVGICIFVSLRIREGRLGRAWLAIREDELAASMMGVPLVKTKLSAYAVGASFGGIGGVAYASGITGSISPSAFNFGVSVTVLLMVVLGGMGNVWGVVIGAVLLSWLNTTGLSQIGAQSDQWFGTNISGVLPRYQFLILGVLLVLMMLFRREGLIPEKRTKALMSTPSRVEMESQGADITEAEAESEAYVSTTPEEDAAIAQSAVFPDAPLPDETGARR